MATSNGAVWSVTGGYCFMGTNDVMGMGEEMMGMGSYFYFCSRKKGSKEDLWQPVCVTGKGTPEIIEFKPSFSEETKIAYRDVTALVDIFTLLKNLNPGYDIKIMQEGF